ncbi:MAG: hypothetical protein NT099_05510 [Candidatus Saganbacteria bacterium]|nr:hypothetical protein [Candidatus Saganbacteria bacterium]
MIGVEFRCEITTRGTAHAGYVAKGAKESLARSQGHSRRIDIAVTDMTTEGKVVGVTASRDGIILRLVRGRPYEAVVKSVLPSGAIVALTTSDSALFGIVPAYRGRDFKVGSSVNVTFHGLDRSHRTLLFSPV